MYVQVIESNLSVVFYGTQYISVDFLNFCIICKNL